VNAEYENTVIETNEYPQIVSSTTRLDKVNDYKKVVVKVPKGLQITDKSSTLVGGEELAGDKSLVWASVIEKLFLENGYVVLSSQKPSSLEDADFIVSLNSLEISTVDRLGELTNIKLKCYKSLSKYSLGDEVPLEHYFSKYWIEDIKEAFSGALARPMRSAYFDASVTDVESGEVFFYYQNKAHSYNPLAKERSLCFIRRVDPINGNRTSVRSDESQAKTKQLDENYFVSSDGAQSTADSMEPMIKQICADFINRLMKE
jgi:hypothetical protein